MAANNKKKELIQRTYQLLKILGPEDVKIREIATASSCTSTTIYKHFDNLDHLILFASIKFLENYIIELQQIISKNTDPLNMLVKMWEVFAKYAFENVEIFDMLFWGKFKNNLGDTIFEYYQMFPREWANLDGLFTSVFFNDDLEERNNIILRRVAAKGYFDYKDLNTINDMQCFAFHGLLMDYKDKYREPGVAKEAKERFMNLLDSLNSHFRIN